MGGFIAIAVSGLAFLVPLAIPLFAQRWRSFALIVALAAVFFLWLNGDIESGGANPIGPFLGGLMLFGFVAGAIAKFVMLVGRRPAAER